MNDVGKRRGDRGGQQPHRQRRSGGGPAVGADGPARAGASNARRTPGQALRLSSAAAGGAAAGVALHAGAVAHQVEVAALAAGALPDEILM